VIINILEYNDQAPEFLPHTNITIDEERPIGTFVMALLAKDQDDAIAEYSLPYNPQNLFAIGFQTGKSLFIMICIILSFTVLMTTSIKQ
jgi:hypothetical protein